MKKNVFNAEILLALESATSNYLMNLSEKKGFFFCSCVQMVLLTGDLNEARQNVLMLSFFWYTCITHFTLFFKAR